MVLQRLLRKGFTLIEILVVIVIIGILATMGIGKYAQFSRDARKSGCVNNQNTIDKGVGMWESKYMVINTQPATELSITFLMNGDKQTVTGGVPPRLKNVATYKSEIFDQIQDGVVFICPESVNAYGGMDNIKSADKDSKTDYKWIHHPKGADDTAMNSTGGKKRGVGCMVWGSIAQAGTSKRSETDGGDGTGGPSGATDDLHSGRL
ncbi:MAG: prepilin-type N-terminal cleavage/methylation domain-containing protein [Candidatus Cloacimonetes bacterium]|nr:prepilin-type N-terminal cleavage/methylation domain-containing protein [Candidatus Cloacimonadota bacterium]